MQKLMIQYRIIHTSVIQIIKNTYKPLNYNIIIIIIFRTELLSSCHMYKYSLRVVLAKSNFNSTKRENY